MFFPIFSNLLFRVYEVNQRFLLLYNWFVD
jgi:hypothetical protein